MSTDHESGRGRVAAAGALVIIVAVIAIAAATGGDADESRARVAESGGTELPITDVPAADVPILEDRGLHPPLVDIDDWLQSDVTSLEELRGEVVAVQFWTFGCSNCRATLPHLQELYAKYRGDGFQIVGVHAPEFPHEAEVPNIIEAAADLGVTWPIALDTSKLNFREWQEGASSFWPRLYLLDRNGHVRYDHIGEGGYADTDAAVRALLDEPR